MAKSVTLTYILDYSVSVIQSEAGVAKNSAKTCAVSRVYDLDKDVVIRKELDGLKDIVTKAMAQKAKEAEKPVNPKQEANDGGSKV